MIEQAKLARRSANNIESHLIRILLFFGAFAVGCGIVSTPQPELVDTSFQSFGSDAVILVYCTVQNHGSEGDVVISAALRRRGTQEMERTIFLAKGASEKVEFTFTEVPDTLTSRTVPPGAPAVAPRCKVGTRALAKPLWRFW